MNEAVITVNNMAKEIMKKFTSPGLRNSRGGFGFLILGLMVLAGLMVNTGRAQNNFASAQVLVGSSGAVTNSNFGVTPDQKPGPPSTAGFPPNAPLWYQWTAPADGEVTLDTISSGSGLDTVLAVYSGATLGTLAQVAANDDLYPIRRSPFAGGQIVTGTFTQQFNESGSGDYAKGGGNFSTAAGTLPVYFYEQFYNGPSALRFNAQHGTTYYFVVDTKSGRGTLTLNWAYKPSGVFRFATEDFDQSTHLPLYQTAQTESVPPDENSVVSTYYTYNAPGVLVTVTRTAGSSGRVMVDYATTSLTSVGIDVPAVGGVDYQPVSGTLVFDDFEMSKTILVPIQSGQNFLGTFPFPASGSGTVSGVAVANTVFGLMLTNARLDSLESSDVSQPRVDPSFSTVMVKILNVNADPYGPDLDTNGIIIPPTNVVFNFTKSNYRVPEDVNDGAVSRFTTVTLNVHRFGTNTAAATINYRINNFLGDDQNNQEEENIFFPLQPGSDYAVPTPAATGGIRGVNPDFNAIQGTLSFPATGAGANVQPLTFTVTNSTLTKFNKDFHIQLYREVTINGVTVPRLPGMVAETTVTILFNDQHPPAGSVDQLYNADFNQNLALPPNQVPTTVPQKNPNPGVDGQVNGLAILTNNEAVIVGQFQTYNGFNQPCIALADTNGLLDTSFNPGSGVNPANNFINAVAVTPGNQIVIGGQFTSYNGGVAGNIARLNVDGSLDTTFNPGSGADGTVWSLAVQSDGKVLIGGDFTHINSTPRNHLARLNTDGSLDTSFTPGATFNGPIYSLALPALSSLNLNSASAGGSNEVDQAVNLGQANSGTLSVSYDMQQQPDDMRVFYGATNGTLIFDTGLVSGTGNFVLPFGPTNGLATNLITIVMDQGGGQAGTLWSYSATVTSANVGQVMAGGDFAVAGQTYRDVARVNTADGSLDASFNAGTGADNPVFALGWQSDGRVVVGGSFTHFNGSTFNRIVRLNTDGSIDTTNFFAGTGANDIINTIAVQFDGTMYVGGSFTSFNGTHRLGFTRLYSDGTVDTTFMDTAYNQFAGLKKIYSYDSPSVFATAVQSDGNVLIGGSFFQVGGGQADTNVCNSLDEELGYTNSFGPNLWVEPKTRDGVRNRSNVARLVGGATPGPGNISLLANNYSANKSQSSLSVSLVRTNGILGPISANFSVLPGLASNGVDYVYNSAPPLYWIVWEYLTTPNLSRLHSDGLAGQNGALVDPYGFSLGSADKLITSQSAVTVTIINNKQSSGNLNAQFQLSNPTGPDQFYLGGQPIPMGGALGVSTAPFTLVDDNKQSGTLGFQSASYIATNLSAAITLVRSNGTFGTVSMRYFVTNGTPPNAALAGTDFVAQINVPLTFNQGVVSNNFNVTLINSGLIYTNINEKEVNLHLSTLSGPVNGNAVFGITNAVLRLINPNYQGYLTLTATNYIGTESSGFISFVVNRTSGSKGSISIQYATTNGTALNGVDYTGTTNQLSWNDGEISQKTVNIPLINNGTVGAGKQFNVRLFNPMNGLNSAPSLMGLITNATLTISNDNSYGILQFSAPSYTVNENGGYATITVTRTGGAVGAVSVNYTTADSTAVSNVTIMPPAACLLFAANQLSSSFTVPNHK